MKPKANKIAASVLAGILLLAAGWCFNLATFNWFAADNPTPYRNAFASRGNIFSIIGFVCLAASVSVIVALARANKKRSIVKN